MDRLRRYLKLLTANRANQAKQQDAMIDGAPEYLQAELLEDLNLNVQMLRSVYANCADIVFRSFLIGGKLQAMLIYIEGLSDKQAIDQFVLGPLMRAANAAPGNLRGLLEQNISVSHVQETHTYAECVQQISVGNPVLLGGGERLGAALGLAHSEKRAVEEPSAESVVRGPREGFVELLSVNTALLRRRIPSPQFKLHALKVGRYTQTEVMIAYIEGLADQRLLEEVYNRLSRIEIDGILESAYIEEFIEDHPYSIFPQVLNTERPDVVAANLLEGRVAILVNGTPFALVVPITLYSLLQSAEDSYSRFIFSTSIRWLRYGFLVIALLFPSLYVAVLSFHQEMIPTSLFFSISKSREEIPFPVLVEAIIMEVTFEALREAGVRLPKQVGAAVSIVGALVIGQAAVSAGIVSAPMVMVVAVTGIASFMMPRYNAGIAIRMLRFPIMLLAGILGLLGIMLGVIAVIVHLCTLRSFGLPYLAPMGPLVAKDLKDVLMRAPRWRQDTRPQFTSRQNEYRQSPGQMPDPAKGPNEG